MIRKIRQQKNKKKWINSIHNVFKCGKGNKFQNKYIMNLMKSMKNKLINEKQIYSNNNNN